MAHLGVSKAAASGPLLLLLIVALGGDPLLAGSPGSVAAPVAIPGHPRELSFGPLRFEVPAAEAIRHQLPGEIPVYVVEDHALPLVDVGVQLRVGAFLDPVDRPGLAALVGTLLRRGGAGSWSARELDQRADYLAANLGSSGGDTSSTATMNCLSSQLDPCLDLLFAMLRDPRFEAERLAVEKENLREGMKQRNDNPQGILGRQWRWLLYGESFYGAKALTARELDAISREELVAFHRRTWRPENMVFGVAGDVSPEVILKALERRLAGWPGTGERSPWPPPGPTLVAHPGVYHVEKDIPQGAVYVGHPTERKRGWDDPDHFATLVMNEILGGSGFTSRITSRVRSDEGLAYSAGSSFSLGDFWPGEFRISYQSKSPTVALAAKIALEEVAKMRATPVTDEELQTAKNGLIESFPGDFESAREIAGTYARDALLGRPHGYWLTWRDNVRKVTAADVQRVAQRYLDPGRMLFVVVGKWAEIEPGDPQQRAKMADFPAATHLPLRDPLTLEPLAP